MSGHVAIPDGVLAAGDPMSPAGRDDVPLTGNAVGNGVSVDHRDPGVAVSRMKVGDRLVTVDLKRITDVINGRIQSPRPITLKAVVRQQLANIRSAQRRGMSIREIALAITEGGCPVEEPTLRKYLHLLAKEKLQRQKPSRKPDLPARERSVVPQSVARGSQSDWAGTESDATDKSLPAERSLRRAKLVSKLNAAS